MWGCRFRPVMSLTGTVSMLAICVVLGYPLQPILMISPVQPDFTLAANPPFFYLDGLGTQTSNITATSIGGFSGTLNYTWTTIPADTTNPTVSFSPFIVSLGAGQSVVSTLSVTIAGRYPSQLQDGNLTVTITATSASLSHAVAVAAISGGVFVSFGTPAMLFPAGSGSAESNVTVRAVNYIGGTVQLRPEIETYTDGFSCVQFPNFVASGFSTQLSNYSVSLPRNGSVNVTLTVSANASSLPGEYLVIVSASPLPGVPVDIMFGVDVTIPGLVLSSDAVAPPGCEQPPAVLSISSGGTGATFVYAHEFNFSCDVTLGVSSALAGINATLTPSVLRFLGSSRANLYISVSGTIPPGTYNILITGTSCGRTGSTTVPVVVTGPTVGLAFLLVVVTTAAAATGIPVAINAMGKYRAASRKLKPSQTSPT